MGVEWNRVSQDRNLWLSLLNIVKNLLVPESYVFFCA
jgi:hypothetical protein